MFPTMTLVMQGKLHIHDERNKGPCVVSVFLFFLEPKGMMI
jgi:hypothetical protein